MCGDASALLRVSGGVEARLGRGCERVPRTSSLNPLALAILRGVHRGLPAGQGRLGWAVWPAARE
jgi:hypothetical protein